jgi:hypothetical protein
VFIGVHPWLIASLTALFPVQRWVSRPSAENRHGIDFAELHASRKTFTKGSGVCGEIFNVNKK